MSKIEGMKTTCLAKRKTMREVSFMMNILRETNKIVEIKFLYNVRIVTSLCFMIWNDMIENDEMNTWYECPMFRPPWKLMKENPWNVHAWT
jgi:hypothetical protein